VEDEIRREVVESVKKIIIDNLHVSRFHKLIKMLELRTGYSYEYIRKIFRESENTTPTQLYNIQKLDQCKKLLKETDYTIFVEGHAIPHLRAKRIPHPFWWFSVLISA